MAPASVTGPRRVRRRIGGHQPTPAALSFGLVLQCVAEQHDECTEMRRHFGLEVLAKVRALSDEAASRIDGTAVQIWRQSCLLGSL